jgi:hypothetical protein
MKKGASEAAVKIDTATEIVLLRDIEKGIVKGTKNDAVKETEREVIGMTGPGPAVTAGIATGSATAIARAAVRERTGIGIVGEGETI